LKILYNKPIEKINVEVALNNAFETLFQLQYKYDDKKRSEILLDNFDTITSAVVRHMLKITLKKLSYFQNKNLEKEIDRDITKYKLYKNNIRDPYLINKYKNNEIGTADQFNLLEDLTISHFGGEETDDFLDKIYDEIKEVIPFDIDIERIEQRSYKIENMKKFVFFTTGYVRRSDLQEISNILSNVKKELNDLYPNCDFIFKGKDGGKYSGGENLYDLNIIIIVPDYIISSKNYNII
jgi:hypothetical protein